MAAVEISRFSRFLGSPAAEPARLKGGGLWPDLRSSAVAAFGVALLAVGLAGLFPSLFGSYPLLVQTPTLLFLWVMQAASLFANALVQAATLVADWIVQAIPVLAGLAMEAASLVATWIMQGASLVAKGVASGGLFWGIAGAAIAGVVLDVFGQLVARVREERERIAEQERAEGGC